MNANGKDEIIATLGELKRLLEAQRREPKDYRWAMMGGLMDHIAEKVEALPILKRVRRESAAPAQEEIQA